MNTYFGFSDESGEVKKNNWYLRTIFLVESQLYQQLSNEFRKIKTRYHIPIEKEFKFSWLWKLKKHKDKIKETEKLYFFRDYNLQSLEEFISESIKLLDKFNPILIVAYTFIFGKLSDIKKKIEIEQDYLKALLLRVEDELKENNSVGVIFYDEINEKKTLSEAYKKIYISARFIGEYTHIKDSLSFEISDYSAGLQIADYVTGITHNFLRGYTLSTDLFSEYLFKWIRRKDNLSIQSSGFIPFYMTKYNKGKKILKDVGQKFRNIIHYLGDQNVASGNHR